jgi:NAD(P)H dehydrogenase (quinone)
MIMGNRILITGAAGSIGTHAVKRLLELNMPVRALVRNTDMRSDALAALGAEVVIGDLSDFNSISAAMKEVSRVLFVYPIAPGLIESADYLAQAALEQKVECIVNISQRTAVRNASSHSAQSSWLAERLLDRSGVPVIHLQPTLFTDWLKYFAQTIKANDTYITPFGDAKFGMIDTEDIAYVAASILTDPKGAIGQTYQLYGPEEINGFDAAAILSEVLQRKITFANLTPEAFGEILHNNGQPDYSTKHLMAVGHMFRTGEFRGMNNNVERLSGRKPLSAKDFILKNIAIY